MEQPRIKIKRINPEELTELEFIGGVRQVGLPVILDDNEIAEISYLSAKPYYPIKSWEEKYKQKLQKVTSNKRIPRKRNNKLPDYYMYGEEFDPKPLPITTHPLFQLSHRIFYPVVFYEKVQIKNF